MSEDCARCGHASQKHAGSGECGGDVMHLCYCRGYRTRTQLEALERAREANDLMLQCVEDNEKAVALRRLVEAFE